VAAGARGRGATSTPEEFGAYIRKDLAKWARVVKEVGIVPE
jgi:tripartite-type tricarboxylate transporter receptor subunit TctC